MTIFEKHLHKTISQVKMDKLLAIAAFILVTSALFIIAITPPATGYEISIYEAYPSYFWFFIILAIACGIVILVRQAFAEKPSRWWIVGFSAILFANLVILLLPIFRGYATFGRWDVLSHIGFTMDILLTGHFQSAAEAGANYYPVIHILVASLYFVTGLTPKLLAMIVPAFFTLFCMISMYLLSREITSTRGQALLIATFGSLLVFRHESSMLASSVQAFFILPFTLLLLYKARVSANRGAYSLLLVLVLLLTPFLHPGEGSLFLILMFLCLGFSVWLYRTVKKPQAIGDKNPGLSGIAPITPSLILFITWFSWFASFAVFGGVVKNIWNWLVHEIGRPTVIHYADILGRAGLSWYEFAELFFKMWGHAVLYCLAASIISMFVWKRFLCSNDKIDSAQFVFSVFFILFGALLFITFFADVWLGYGRAMRYTIFAATALNGLGLYTLFHKHRGKIGMILITSLLIAAATVGVFNTFSSPIGRGINFQVTNMEMTGMGWFFNHRDDSLLIYEKDVGQARFFDVLYGRATPRVNIRCQAPPPDHFGYLENDMFGESFVQDTYFIENKLSRIAHPEVFPEFKHMWKFTSEDFERIDNKDPSVNRIYSNGEFWVFFVQGMGTLSP